MKLAIFGGTFDPPHLGHLAFAKAALAALQPDRLVWMPAGIPWQKPDQRMAPAAQRVAMIERLIAGEPHFGIDERELHRRGPSFTAHTLQEFRAEQPQAELLFLIGQDQYGKLHTWFQVETVLALATLVVVPRAGQAVQAPAALPAHRLRVLDLPDTPISSTAVRESLARGDDIRPMVGDDVASYIGSHRLYTES